MPVKHQYTIDKCLCIGKTFAELSELAKARGWSSDDLERMMRATKAGEGCGLCQSYLGAMLETGQTVFHEVLVLDPPKPIEAYEE